MGAWGAGLYDDDEACDVRDTISLLAQMPRDGDWILEQVTEQFGRNTDLNEDGCPTFWLAVAEQFAKRGIHPNPAAEMAVAAIESAADVKDLKARGMEEEDLRRRKMVHEKLLARLASPKKPEARRVSKSPPKSVVEAGEVYVFPAMDGAGFNAWFADWAEAGFSPDGWGAIVVLDSGRIYDWFPWAAYVALALDDFSQKPSQSDISEARPFSHLSVMHCLPRKSHLKRMGAELLGRFPLDPKCVHELLERARYQPKDAVLNNWSISSGTTAADSPNWDKLERGVLFETRS